MEDLFAIFFGVAKLSQLDKDFQAKKNLPGGGFLNIFS